MKLEDLENEISKEKESKFGKKFGLACLAGLLAVITVLVIFLK